MGFPYVQASHIGMGLRSTVPIIAPKAQSEKPRQQSFRREVQDVPNRSWKIKERLVFHPNVFNMFVVVPVMVFLKRSDICRAKNGWHRAEFR